MCDISVPYTDGREGPAETAREASRCEDDVVITREQIEQLEAFDGRGARVLSVYLDLEPTRHLQRAMGRAVEMAGTAEVVRGDAARRLMEAGQGVGALLRYR